MLATEARQASRAYEELRKALVDWFNLDAGGHLTPLLYQPAQLFISCNSFHISTFRPLVFEPMLN